MTSEEKRDKREARQQVIESLRPVVRRQSYLMGFSPAQERHHLRTLVDRFYAEQVMPAAKRIESQVLQGAYERSQRQPTPAVD